ncbi:MAG: hypothetical protein U0169_06205 [Polyangiaceae bacterium]
MGASSVRSTEKYAVRATSVAFGLAVTLAASSDPSDARAADAAPSDSALPTTPASPAAHAKPATKARPAPHATTKTKSRSKSKATSTKAAADPKRSEGAAFGRPAGESAAKVVVAPAPDQPAWCREGLETLPGSVCHIDGGSEGGRHTLVVFLHGAIAKGTTWQWGQEQALTRHAKQSHFEALFPMAPLTSGGFLWPGSPAARDASEASLLASWQRARKILETRRGRPYDEVFLMGFSSGAYFVSSLALRHQGAFDGYAVFAGGTAFGVPDVAEAKPPVFVGVCANDKTTASHSRTFGATLASLGFRHRVDEENVGHEFSDVHLAHAVAWLRSTARPNP